MSFKAILFDLDGTLLPLEFADFMPLYLSRVESYFHSMFEPGKVSEAIMVSTNAMIDNDGSRSNADAFWPDFAARLERSREELEPLFEAFYKQEFPKLGRDVDVWPEAAVAVDSAVRQGAVTVCATNPVFPRSAIDHRLIWAGIRPDAFDLVSDYANSRFTKPNPGFYSDLSEIIKTEPEECLMVGNDTFLDLEPAKLAGMKTYLIDSPFSANGNAFEPNYHGTLGDLAALINP